MKSTSNLVFPDGAISISGDGLFMAEVINALNAAGILQKALSEKDVEVIDRARAKQSNELYYFEGRRGEDAKGHPVGSNFRVLKGSIAANTCTDSGKKLKLYSVRNELLSKGILRWKEGKLEFTEDYDFNSSSLAAGVVVGRSADGPREWINENGVSLKHCN